MKFHGSPFSSLVLGDLCADPKMDAVGVEIFLLQRNQLYKLDFHSFDEKVEIGKFDFIFLSQYEICGL